MFQTQLNVFRLKQKPCVQATKLISRIWFLVYFIYLLRFTSHMYLSIWKKYKQWLKQTNLIQIKACKNVALWTVKIQNDFIPTRLSNVSFAKITSFGKQCKILSGVISSLEKWKILNVNFKTILHSVTTNIFKILLNSAYSVITVLLAYCVCSSCCFK